MNKLNKYLSDSFQIFFDSNLSTTDPELYKAGSVVDKSLSKKF